MSSVCDFLVELGTEEMPAKSLKLLMQALEDNIIAGITEHKLAFSKSNSYATPRRFAVMVSGLQLQQDDKLIVKKGPSLKAAFDVNNQPTKAALGFANSVGVAVTELSADTSNGWLIYKQQQKGLHINDIMPIVIAKALADLPIARKMRWGSGNDEFIRPVKWLLMMADDQVINCSVLGVTADKFTYGHHFHAPECIALANTSEYLTKLRTEGKVEPCFTLRQQIIEQQIKQQAANIKGNLLIDNNLLEEVTAMVEWPCAFVGEFLPKYLEIPIEVLVSTMQEHQKYFPVVDKNNNLMPYFIGVANIQSKDIAIIVKGNEKVIRPRFADALFCFEADKKQTQTQRSKQLSKVLFNQDLGSLLDKTTRISNTAIYIASQIKANIDNTKRAAKLCKADIVSQMVQEFPHLQGVMGSYYATYDGENQQVANAIKELYLPRFANDIIPQSTVGMSLSLADKFDTLVGMFIINQPPTGSKDPYALRRACIGIIRIIIEEKLNLDISKILELAIENYQQQHVSFKLPYDKCIKSSYNYLINRIESYYEEQDTIINSTSYAIKKIVNSVTAFTINNLYDMNCRLHSLIFFIDNQENTISQLIATNKRLKNILSKIDINNIPILIDKSLISEKQEITLVESIQAIEDKFASTIQNKNYIAAINILVSLHPAISAFFEAVMVNVEDMNIRNNRISILYKLQQKFLSIADISLLK